MWKLSIEDDDGKRTVLSLTRDEYTVGRREGSAIRLTERNVSRDHAKLSRLPESVGPTAGATESPERHARFLLADLASYNGVFINGLRVADAQTLEHGDLIQIGDYRIIVTDDTISGALDASTITDVDRTLPIAPQARASELMDRPNRLVMLIGPTPGAEFALGRDKLTIGRSEEADIPVKDNSVSRIHCEVHSIGDGRFEIVDMGSSNGVQVNGSELRRGIIEPGDTIELGDVRFKFVGAGQIFRPDAYALATRPSRLTQVSRLVRSNAAPLSVFLVVALSGIAGAWILTRSNVAARSAGSPTVQAIARARMQCSDGDCEAAHDTLLSEVPESSEARRSKGFQDVEGLWADGLLARADGVADLDAKRALYLRISQTVTVDAARRKIAADRLALLDSASAATDPMNLPRAAAAERPEPLARVAASEDAAGQAGSPEGSGETGSGKDMDDRERQLALAGTVDAKMKLKQQLEPRVYSGRASEAEIRLLVSVCKDVGDKACVQQARAILKQAAP